jgi:Domain of unknown function (DUF1902)
MNNVVRPNFNRRIAPFVVDIQFDNESAMWVAVCDALSVCTEAPSYEAVTARFWEIAPEIAAANGVTFNADSRIEFRHIEDATSRIAM